MSAPAKSRISTIETIPWDPYGDQNWNESSSEDPRRSNTTSLLIPDAAAPGPSSPSFDPVYPFSPFQPSADPAPSWHAAPEGAGLFYAEPSAPAHPRTVSPPTREYRYDDDNDLVSPLSPPVARFPRNLFPAAPPPAAEPVVQPRRSVRRIRPMYDVDMEDPPSESGAGDGTSRAGAADSLSRQSTVNSISGRSTVENSSILSAADSTSKRLSTASSLYKIPEAPPPPILPPGLLDTDSSYESVKINILGNDDMESEKLVNRRSQRMSRQPSMAQRLGSRLMGSVQRNRTSASSGWRGTVRRSRITATDEDYTELRELEEREEAGEGFEPIGFDISTFGPEFAVPTIVAQAMDDHGCDPDLVYTDKGEAIALSNLLESDTLQRAGTMGTIGEPNRDSFYFPPTRQVPNWKPVVLQTWYLVLLIIFTIAMIVGIEVLYQLSDRHILRPGDAKTREGGGLFAYREMEDLSVLQFAIWKYVPTVIGVVYGIVWKVTDEELKRSEPYYRLSKGSTGALAAESLNIEYHTVWSPMVPVEALKYRQFVVAAGGVVSFLAASAVPIYLSVIIRVDPSQKERKHMKDGGKHAIKRLVVDGLWTRLLQVTLGVILILAIYIMVKLMRRRSGLLGDPSGIAGVAAMANKSHILMDFRNLDVATEEMIHKQLNKRTYILHKGALWQAQAIMDSERDQAAPKPMNPHPLLLRPEGMGPFMLFCILMVVLLPVMVYNSTANVIIDKTPWIITGISILVKSIWELLEKEMRMLEPFWILFNRRADPSVLTLDYSATIPGFIVLKALTKGHLLLAWVTFVTVLIEVLTVVMGSLDAQGGEESTLSSTVSFALAIIIFVLVFFTGGLVLHHRRDTFLPRQPGTISSVLAFIHQSRMLTDFGGTEQKTTLERKRKLGKLGKEYGFGWYLGRDGKRHLGIDHEPLLKDYKFGEDPSKAVVDGPPLGWERWDGSA